VTPRPLPARSSNNGTPRFSSNGTPQLLLPPPPRPRVPTTLNRSTNSNSPARWTATSFITDAVDRIKNVYYLVTAAPHDRLSLVLYIIRNTINH